ncbi:MAG: DUF1905 domain-containing protein, partial [Elusimicrobiota bacterium]
VSAARAARLKSGWRKPLPVLLRVNGTPDKPWRVNMMPAGDGSFYLYLHAAVRGASRTSVGDKVAVELAFDPAYRGGPQAIPPRFRAAVARSAKARKSWARLPPSRKKEIVRYLRRLKSAEALERNLSRAMLALTGESGRFMGRLWTDGK